MKSLIADNLGLAHWAARRYGLGLDPDDAVAICYLRLCEIIPKYDPAKGAFATYAIFRMRGALLDEKRRIYGRKNYTARPIPLSLDELKQDFDFDVQDPHAWEPYASSGLWQLIKYLDRREQEILYFRFVEGKSLAWIAQEHLGLSEARVGQINRRAIKKLRLRLAAQAVA